MQGATVDTSKVKWPTVKDVLAQIGIISAPGDPAAQFVWFDWLPTCDMYGQVRQSQRSNRIPGMDVVCYKTSFFNALKRMKSTFPDLYRFFPTTYLLPNQYVEFTRDHYRASLVSRPVWIWKPRAGSCGEGIRLVLDAHEVSALGAAAVIQRYVSPYLVDGLKFDLRLWICVASLDPFSLFLYNEGLARFCSVPFEAPSASNVGDRFMHLSNTAINKLNDEAPHEILELATDVISRISAVDPRGAALWCKICDVAFLAVVAQYPEMMHGARGQPLSPAVPPLAGLGLARQYFHLLGIDIIVNERCEPVVLELNDRPCLTVTAPIEQQLKEDLLASVMTSVTRDGSDPPSMFGFTRLWPTDGPEAQHREAVFGQACWLGRAGRPVARIRRPSRMARQ